MMVYSRDLGVKEDVLSAVANTSQKIILFCGATGSGLTTTMECYARTKQGLDGHTEVHWFSSEPQEQNQVSSRKWLTYNTSDPLLVLAREFSIPSKTLIVIDALRDSCLLADAARLSEFGFTVACSLHAAGLHRGILRASRIMEDNSSPWTGVFLRNLSTVICTGVEESPAAPSFTRKSYGQSAIRQACMDSGLSRYLA